jgi:elongation factor P--beta-lysine ligase
MAIDEQFLADLSSPLPFCSGVAIGIERLLETLA